MWPGWANPRARERPEPPARRQRRPPRWPTAAGEKSAIRARRHKTGETKGRAQARENETHGQQRPRPEYTAHAIHDLAVRIDENGAGRPDGGQKPERMHASFPARPDQGHGAQQAQRNQKAAPGRPGNEMRTEIQLIGAQGLFQAHQRAEAAGRPGPEQPRRTSAPLRRMRAARGPHRPGWQPPPRQSERKTPAAPRRPRLPAAQY